MDESGKEEVAERATLEQPLIYCHGEGMMLPVFEQAMLGKEVDETFDFVITPDQAYLATQPVERAYLFGSCARGEERPDSDIDLLVNYTDNNSLSLMDIGGMIDELSRSLQRPVDLIEEDFLMPFARPSANKDKIKIYERSH